LFYFYALLIALYSWLFYAIFRSGIYDLLRLSKRSKSYIRKNRKGIKNYWLYSQIHQEHPLGAVYYLNIVFLFLLLIFSIITILFGYVMFLRIPVVVLATLLCLIEIPSMIWFARIDALSEYGKTFVLLARRRENRGYYSSVFYISSCIIPVALVILCIKVTLTS
jgi:hypothetical protein